jgi:hypothetical protein
MTASADTTGELVEGVGVRPVVLGAGTAGELEPSGLGLDATGVGAGCVVLPAEHAAIRNAVAAKAQLGAGRLTPSG